VPVALDPQPSLDAVDDIGEQVRGYYNIDGIDAGFVDSSRLRLNSAKRIDSAGAEHEDAAKAGTNCTFVHS
jgi:hypothetical protein